MPEKNPITVKNIVNEARVTQEHELEDYQQAWNTASKLASTLNTRKEIEHLYYMLLYKTQELDIEYEKPTTRLPFGETRPNKFALPGLGASKVILISKEGKKQSMVLSQYFDFDNDNIRSALCQRSVDLLTPEDEYYALKTIPQPTLSQKIVKRINNLFSARSTHLPQLPLPKTKREIALDGIEEYIVRKKGNREIKRHHFTKWPDRGVIYPEIFKQLIESVFSANGNSLDKLLIRCWGGKGRTGTFASGIIFYDWFVNNASATEKSDYDFLIKKMLEIILFLRQVNGEETIESSSQLQLLLDFITLLTGKSVIVSLKEIPDPILDEADLLAYQKNIRTLKGYKDYYKKQMQRNPANKEELRLEASQMIYSFMDKIILSPPKIGPPPLPRGDQ